MDGSPPVSVVIVTKNEEWNLPRCLSALKNFEDIYVVDSGSRDNSRGIAESFGAVFVDFQWSGQYPKKRQWCLDHLPLKHDFVFFVDADEEVTGELVQELSALDFACAGYFVKGAYVVKGKPLAFGLRNNKLCLINRTLMEFPVVDDLCVEGMGEIEGHYQPVLKQDVTHKIGQLKSALLHHAYDDEARYRKRHAGYKIWEEGLPMRAISDPLPARRFLKAVFLRLPCRNMIAFLHGYVVLGGFLDGNRGFFHAKCRYDYYSRRRAR